MSAPASERRPWRGLVWAAAVAVVLWVIAFALLAIMKDGRALPRLAGVVTLLLGVPMGIGFVVAAFLAGRRHAAAEGAAGGGAGEDGRATTPPLALPLRARTSSECPYCKTPTALASEPTVRCPACATPHHAECWREHGGCTTLGCARAPREGPRGRSTSERVH